MSREAVWKYSLHLGPNDLELPQDSPIVHVEQQDGAVCMWAIVTPGAPSEWRRFFVVGTGQALPEQWRYHGTAQIPPYVWHVFETVKSRVVEVKPSLPRLIEGETK